MSPFYQEVDINQRERVALAPGSYGTSTQPGLKIMAYIDKASKKDKSGAMRHSFLVAATRPSREQIQEQAKNGNGGMFSGGEHPFEPDFEGTAFLSITIHEDWTHPAALAMAFTEATRNKEGKLGKDYLAEAIASGEVDAKVAEEGKAYYRKIATEKVIAANTPPEKIDEAIEAQYRKELMQISIKMGEFFTLLDWAGIPRDPNHDPITLVGTEFSGKVETSNFGANPGNTEVTRVYSRSKKKAEAAA
ncbi:hypothetical protein J2P12_00125 [Candidatus Bathyarchaeota archaeon]|nr:hypothetical protein [Candidatus Bathyarchaeota archaeon]